MPKNEFLPDGTTFSSHSRNGSTTFAEDTSNASSNAEVTNQAMGKTEDFTIGKLTSPSKPPSPAPRKESSYVQLAASNLEKFLCERSCHKITKIYNLQMLWSADKDPPITKEKLSELDLDRLYNNLYLRHDLNFDRQIHFSPRSPNDALGRQKKIEAQLYWEAVEIELALHISHLDALRLRAQPGGPPQDCCSLPAPSTLRHVPLRLSRMMRHICRIIATLVPYSMEPSVKSKLDHKMFMQELEHGQCDIEALFAWIGALLLQSCAPSRDSKINDMMTTISHGYRNHDPCFLSRGLQDVFSILEIMKLDATNYQFQLHRNYMLLRSIETEQAQIRTCLKSGWQVSNWLQPLPTSPKPTFTFLISSLLDLITSPGAAPCPLPTALTLDFSRIVHLRSTFQALAFRAACISTLAAACPHLGCKTPPPVSSTRKLNDLITSLDDNTANNDRYEDIILAIAQLASSSSPSSAQSKPLQLPSPATLAYVRQTLHANTSSSSTPTTTITPAQVITANSLALKLRKAIDRELNEIEPLKLSAMGLAQRYTAPESTQKLLVAGKKISIGIDDSDAGSVEAKGVEEMAKRIVHLGVLHWRVWSGVLYLKDSEGGGGRDEGLGS